MSLAIPSSPALTNASVTTIASPSADVEALRELIGNMRNTLGTLGATFDALSEQKARVEGLAPQLEAQEQMQSLQNRITRQDERYTDALEEVKDLLKNVIQVQLFEYLRQRVEEMIDDVFEEEVERQVAIELEEHLPQALQDQLHEHRAHLDEVQRSLRNSEARRANAVLRYSNMREPLHPLVTNAGVVSPQFPRDLAELFALDGAKAKALVTEYELSDISESKERNLNKFMQHCGIMYQMVPTLPSSPI